MSKPVKNMMISDYQRKLEGVGDALVVSIRGLEANENNRLRQELAGKDIRITVVRNSLAKHAFAGTTLEALVPVLDGPSALCYGAESVVDVARELMKWSEEVEQLELKGACIEGEFYEGEKGVEAVSKLPTREEAIANVVTLVLSPGRNLGGAMKGPAGVLAACIKAVQEKLENGEEIKKVG